VGLEAAPSDEAGKGTQLKLPSVISGTIGKFGRDMLEA
jgi:hypothetical protein